MRRRASTADMRRHGFPGGRASRIIAGFGTELRHTLSMDSEPLKVQEKLAVEYHARWEAVEIVKAQELAAMTEERAQEMILSLVRWRLGVSVPIGPAWSSSRRSFSEALPSDSATGSASGGRRGSSLLPGAGLALLLYWRAGIATLGGTAPDPGRRSTLTGFGAEESFADPLLARFVGRRSRCAGVRLAPPGSVDSDRHGRSR